MQGRSLTFQGAATPKDCGWHIAQQTLLFWGVTNHKRTRLISKAVNFLTPDEWGRSGGGGSGGIETPRAMPLTHSDAFPIWKVVTTTSSCDYYNTYVPLPTLVLRRQY